MMQSSPRRRRGRQRTAARHLLATMMLMVRRRHLPRTTLRPRIMGTSLIQFVTLSSTSSTWTSPLAELIEWIHRQNAFYVVSSPSLIASVTSNPKPSQSPQWHNLKECAPPLASPIQVTSMRTNSGASSMHGAVSMHVSCNSDMSSEQLIACMELVIKKRGGQLEYGFTTTMHSNGMTMC